LTIWHCILSAELTKTHSFRLFFFAHLDSLIGAESRCSACSTSAINLPTENEINSLFEWLIPTPLGLPIYLLTYFFHVFSLNHSYTIRNLQTSFLKSYSQHCSASSRTRQHLLNCDWSL